MHNRLFLLAGAVSVGLLLLLLPAAARGQWSFYDTANSGLGDTYVFSVGIDRNDNKWFGTYVSQWLGGSLTRFDGNMGWYNYNEYNSGIGQNPITSIAFDTLGNIWLGTLSAGVLKFDGNATWVNYNQGDDSGLAGLNISDIAVDLDNNIWIGTNGAGISRYDGNTTWVIFRVPDGLVSNQILCIYPDRYGDIWFGTYGGLSRFDGVTTWTNYTVANSDLSSDSVRALAMDQYGYLWIATSNGVNRFDRQSEWVVYDTADGLKSNRTMAVAVDSVGNIWVGHPVLPTRGVWLSQRKPEGRWFIHDIDQYLASADVTSIAVDATGDVWFATFGQGVTRCDPDLTDAPDADEEEMPRNFELKPNFPNPFNAGTIIKYALARKGHVVVQIYDLLGRQVKTLIDETQPAGEHSARWDGRDSDGREAATGIYLYRLQVGDAVLTEKMLLIK